MTDALTNMTGTPLRGSATIPAGSPFHTPNLAVIPNELRDTGAVDRDANVTVIRQADGSLRAAWEVTT